MLLESLRYRFRLVITGNGEEVGESNGRAMGAGTGSNGIFLVLYLDWFDLFLGIDLDCLGIETKLYLRKSEFREKNGLLG